MLKTLEQHAAMHIGSWLVPDTVDIYGFSRTKSCCNFAFDQR
jgi:hypothetical protein